MSGFNELLGIVLLGPGSEGYELEMEIKAEHLHAAGNVHGGVYLSLLDTVISRATRELVDDESYVPTLCIHASFFRPVNKGRIRAIAKVVNQSRRFFHVQGELFDDSEKLLAQGSATMFRKE